MSPSKTNKLSLCAAVLININIMLGSGIFINTVLLTRNTGPFGPLAYVLMGLILIPLIFTFMSLLKICEGGSFYDFGALINPLVGFITSFSYFIAKLSSCALCVHVFVTFIQQAFPVLKIIDALVFDSFIIILFVCLNMLNIRTGQSIQYGFLALKLTPILFAILSGLFLFQAKYFLVPEISLSSTFANIPFVLYAFAGFEACCSLSRNIVDSKRNAPRAILISYCIGVCLAVLYQAMFYGALGHLLGKLSGYSEAFPVLIKTLLPLNATIGHMLLIILSIGIASSSLGAAYGIMYSNVWNIFKLASHNYVLGSRYLTLFNKNNIPFIAIILQGVIAISYLLISRGNQVPLQQINSFGMATTYTLSALALIIYEKRYLKKINIISLFALASCSLLIFGFLRNMTIYSPLPIIIFILIITLGSIISLIRLPYRDIH